MEHFTFRKDRKTLSIGSSYSTIIYFAINTRLSRYGKYTFKQETASLDQTFAEKWIVDLDATYNLTDSLSFTLGADNIFNTYPEKSKIIDGLGDNYYAQNSPFGLYGGYYYGRVNYRF